MSNKTKVLFAILIIAAAAASRLVKHPFNFTPMAAMALFAGCYLKKYWAVVLPLGAMLVGDYFIGFYNWRLMAPVYLGITLAFAIGWFLNQRLKWYTLVFSSLAASVIFFLLTNFAVWAFSGWYALTWAGLLNCFYLALPFFRNTVAGDLVYSGAFFGLYELVIAWGRKIAVQPVDLS